jgi:AcrR family transcriptional regulator
MAIRIGSSCFVSSAPMAARSVKNGDGGTPPRRNRIGRPRASGQPAGEPSPRDEIIAAAAKLFADRGFTQTTMSDIARAAGLRQSSLYYWFNRKELILQAAFAVNRLPLDFIERIGAGSGSPALKLYRLVHFDTLQLCRSPWDVHEVIRLATREPELFGEYWADRQRLHDWVVLLLRAGVEEGEFVAGDAQLTALALLSFDEAMQHWVTDTSHRRNGAPPFRYPGFEPEAVADFMATTALRSVMRRPSELERLRGRARELDRRDAATHPETFGPVANGGDQGE